MPTSTYGRPASGDVSFRRAMALVFMSLVLPGTAHIVMGWRRLGVVVLRIWLALVAFGVLAALVFLVDSGLVLSIAVRPAALSVLRWGAIVIGVGWAVVVAHAYVLAHPPSIEGRRRLIASVTTLAVCLVILGPALFLSNIARSQQDFLALFPDTGVSDLPDRVNILLLGGDAGVDREGLRPDSINVASVDVDTGRAILFGLPRNMQQVPFPDGSTLDEEFPDGFGCDDGGCMLNGVYTYAVDRPELFEPDLTPEERGAVAMKQAVGATLGLDVQYYALVDLNGFEGIVDALGGVQIDVQSRVPIGGNADDPSAPVEGYIEPGVQTLGGHEALWYARSRTDSNDYVRMQRQRCVIGGILGQADPATVVLNYTELAESAESTISTDIARGVLDDLIDVALKTKSQPLTSVQFVPPLVPDTSDPDFDAIRATVDSAITASEAAPVEPESDAPPEDAGGAPDPEAGGDPEGGDTETGTDPESPAAPEEPVAVEEVCSYG